MPSLPPRDNRVLLAMDSLKDDIQNGKLRTILPSERELAQRLRISRKTLGKAVSMLEVRTMAGIRSSRSKKANLQKLQG